MRILIALVVWIGAVAGAAEVSTVVAHSIHNQPGGSSQSTSLKAVDSGSFFRAPNLERALATIRSRLGANVQLNNVALYPGYLAVTALKGGGESDVVVYSDGRYVQTDTNGSPGSEPHFSLARIKASAPEAIARRIAKSGHVPESQLNYMVLEVDSSTHKFQWLVYPVRSSRVEYFQVPEGTGRLFELLKNSPTGPRPVPG